MVRSVYWTVCPELADQQLVCRRHVDLQRVNSALCSR